MLLNGKGYLLNVEYDRAYTRTNFVFIYINDVVNISNLLDLILFADDTNIFMHHENLEKLVEILNE